MAKRGTEREKATKQADNWTGKEFKKYAREVLKKLEDEGNIVINRGTKRIKVEDIPTPKDLKMKGKWVSTGRGTGKRKL